MTLPDGWRMVKIGEVADTALGKMLDKGRSSGLPRVRYLRNVNVQWGRVDTHDLYEMELADADRDRFGVEPGDLLVCEGGEIGRAAIWRGDGEYVAFQKALHRIRPGGELDASYLRYALELAAQDGVLEGYSTGSTIAHLPQQQVRAVPIALAPLDEQRNIVEVLEQHLGRLNLADESCRRAARQSLSLIAVQRNLQVLTARGGMSTVGDSALSVEYGSGAKASNDPSGVPVLRMGNIQSGRVDRTNLKFLPRDHEDVRRLALNPGDLLFNRTNSAEHVGKSAVWRDEGTATFASYLIRVRFNNQVVPEWAAHVINSVVGRQYIDSVVSQQVGQANVNGTKLRALPLPLPSLEEQSVRVRRIDETVQSATRVRRDIETHLKRSAALRRALLRAAFSGQLTGRSSDLNRAEELVS